MFRFFTRKKPLTSRAPNNLNINYNTNPLIRNTPIEKTIAKFIKGSKSRNPNIFTDGTIFKIRDYLKMNPDNSARILASRFNSSQPDLKGVSQEDIDDMKFQLTRTNMDGGERDYVENVKISNVYPYHNKNIPRYINPMLTVARTKVLKNPRVLPINSQLRKSLLYNMRGNVPLNNRKTSILKLTQPPTNLQYNFSKNGIHEGLIAHNISLRPYRTRKNRSRK
jgi:hypothetical protein